MALPAAPAGALLDPDLLFVAAAHAHHNRRYREAVACWEVALAQNPYHLNSLAAFCWWHLHRLDLAHALPLFARIRALAPNDRRTLSLAAAIALHLLRDFSLAESLIETALTLHPDDRQLRWQRDEIDMLRGNWQVLPAWTDFRDHLLHGQNGQVTESQLFGLPRWQGERLNGTVLLLSSVGFGDAFQFLRYVPLARRRVQRVVLGIPLHPELAPLLRHQKWVGEVWTGEGKDRQLPCQVDAVAFLDSLPAIFGTTPDTIPPSPKIKASAAHLRLWRQRLQPYAGLRKIGICWSASDTPSGWHRSCPVALLKPLSETPHAVFISLQKGARPPAELGIITFPDAFTDWADTASLIACCDEIVTVDTSIAHVAGTMQKPTLLLLPYTADWRWGQGRTTGWYPRSMRILRQPSLGNWPPVITQTVEELQALIGADSLAHDLTRPPAV